MSSMANIPRAAPVLTHLRIPTLPRRNLGARPELTQVCCPKMTSQANVKAAPRTREMSLFQSLSAPRATLSLIRAASCSVSLQNAVVAAGGEAEFGDRVFQDLFALGSQHAVFANARAHLCIRVNVLVEEAAELRVARGDDAVPYGFGRLRHTGACEVFVRNSRHVDLNIDTVHERTGDLGHVALNLWRRAEAFAAEVIREATRAGIGGRDKNERSRESECHCSASYCDSSVFKRLPEHLQNVAREFGKLIEEEHTVVRHADFAGPWNRPAANKSGVGDRVVW